MAEDEDHVNDSNSVPPTKDAGPRIGTPAIVTQWDEKGRVRRQIECLRVGQLALHENMLLVLEGDRVRGVVRLGDLQSVRVEMLRSFKHPVIGAVIGLVMIGAPISVLLGDPFFLGGILGGDFLCFTGGFLLLLGGYTLFEVFRMRKSPWLIAQTPVGEIVLALDRALSPEESSLLAALGASD